MPPTQVTVGTGNCVDDFVRSVQGPTVQRSLALVTVTLLVTKQTQLAETAHSFNDGRFPSLRLRIDFVTLHIKWFPKRFGTSFSHRLSSNDNSIHWYRYIKPSGGTYMVLAVSLPQGLSCSLSEIIGNVPFHRLHPFSRRKKHHDVAQ